MQQCLQQVRALATAIWHFGVRSSGVSAPQLHCSPALLRAAAGAAVLVMMSVAFMLLCQAQYSRYRRLVLWSHLVAISIMVSVDCKNPMPVDLFPATTPTCILGVSIRFMPTCFKMLICFKGSPQPRSAVFEASSSSISTHHVNHLRLLLKAIAWQGSPQAKYVVTQLVLLVLILFPLPLFFLFLLLQTPLVQMATSMPQFLSASTSSLMAHRMLVLLFKMGVTWPIMAALMHRLPWQDLAVLCSAFCTYLCCTWAQPLCSHLHRSAEDAELVRSLAAALDTLTGLGMETAAAGVGHASAIPALGSSRTGPNTSYSTYSINSTSRHEQLLTDPGRVSWAPLAQHIAAACVTGTAAAGADGASSLAHAYSGHAVLSGGDCQALLMGQCSAVVTTLTAWVGVLVILFFVVLSEQHSKWRWWHSAAARWQGRPPHEYEATSGWGYVGLRLLYLHILLDLPLMLLWVASSSWYRQPTAALGDYNLF